jgi:hypothetical protein
MESGSRRTQPECLDTGLQMRYHARNMQLIIQVPQANPPPVVMPAATVSRVPSRAPSPQLVETELEFSDTNTLTCLLCARAFKSLDQLKRHNKESDLHKVRHFICQ